MSYSILLIVFVLAVFIFVYYSFVLVKRKRTQYNYTPIESYALNANETELLRLINEHRINLQLEPLIPELLANKVCLDRNLKDIDLELMPSHDGWYEMVQDCMPKDGDQIFGEYYTTPLSCFNGYLNSKNGHKEALEKKDRTHIGLSFMHYRNYCLILKY